MRFVLSGEGRLVPYLAALPVGWDREHHERSAGLHHLYVAALTLSAFSLVTLRLFSALRLVAPGTDRGNKSTWK